LAKIPRDHADFASFLTRFKDVESEIASAVGDVVAAIERTVLGENLHELKAVAESILQAMELEAVRRFRELEQEAIAKAETARELAETWPDLSLATAVKDATAAGDAAVALLAKVQEKTIEGKDVECG
jgi:hypothetical protein